MRALLTHIERAKEQPHHVRRSLALGIAFATSSLIGLVWFASMILTDSFAIHGSSFAESTGSGVVIAADSTERPSGLVGAASAALGVSKTPAHIEIVGTATSSTLSDRERESEQTVIPF